MNSRKNAGNSWRIRSAAPGRYWPYLLVFLFAGALLGACATQVLPPAWPFQREAIDLQIKADPELNRRDGDPHTVLVCIYQLKNPIAFDRLAADTAGLYTLLECESFDASVATSQRLFVAPGQKLQRTFDRAEGVRHVALVAGYYTIEKDRIARVQDVPVEIRESGFFSRKSRQHPRDLEMEVILGPKQILSVTEK